MKAEHSAPSFHLMYLLQRGHYENMEPAQSHVQLELEIYERSSAGDSKKHRVSAERCRRKTTSEDHNEGLVYSERELIKRLKQTEKDVKVRKYPIYSDLEETFKSLGI